MRMADSDPLIHSSIAYACAAEGRGVEGTTGEAERVEARCVVDAGYCIKTCLGVQDAVRDERDLTPG